MSTPQLPCVASPVTYTQEWLVFWSVCLFPVLEFPLCAFPLGFPEQGEVHQADHSHPEAEVWW